MAQEKKAEAGASVVDLKGGEGPRVLPSSLANTHGNVGAADRVVLLVAKASQSGVGYYFPLAAAGLQDLPEDLRRQVVGVVHGGFPAVALAPLNRERTTVRYLLARAGHPGAPEDIRRALAGDQAPLPNDRTTGHVAVGYDAFRDYAKLSVLRFEDKDDEKVVYQLDATPAPPLPENFVFPAWVEVSRVLRLDAAAFARGPGTPLAFKAQFGKEGAAGLGFGALEPSGLVFPRDAADNLVEKLLGNNEDGATYSDGGRTPYAVQVLVDPVKGAEAGDPTAQVAKATGAGRESTRHGVGGDNISAVLGIFAASSAVTAVAAGAVNPAVAFGSFLVMLGGVALAMACVRAP